VREPHDSAPVPGPSRRRALIADRGILLLRETGMDEPSIDAEVRDKLAELAQLERAIGKAGMLALRPLMMATGKDIWQLTLLGR